MKAETITGVNALPPGEGEQKKGKADKKAGKRIGYNYIVVKSFKESQKNDVVKCFYIKSLTKWGFCVIKEGTYGDTKDKHGRDIIDRLKWQEKLHKELHKELRIPKWLASFEENGNFYLVIELIGGKSLTSMVRKYEKTLRQELLHGGKNGIRFIGYIIQIVELLEKLHQKGVVHRDATGGNFMITKSGKVALIDMELSYSVKDQFPSPQFDLGTFGYMSPQQEKSQIPTLEEDVFALGAIIMQVFTSMSPNKFTGLPGEALERKVRFFIPDTTLSNLVIQMLDPEPAKRPALHHLKAALIQYKKDKSAKRQRLMAETYSFSRSTMLEIIQDGIDAFSTPLLADKEKGWFAENTKLPLNPEKGKINKAWYGSFYNGVAGVIYYMCQAKKAGMAIASCESFIEKGFELIKTKYINQAVSSHPGLYYGAAGISITMQQAMQQGLLPYTRENILNAIAFLQRENAHLDHLNGISGQGLAILYSQSLIRFADSAVTPDLFISQLLQTQNKDGSWPKGKKDNGRRIHLSFAYGISGILHFLLSYYKETNDNTVLLPIEKGLQCLMSQANYHKDALVWRKDSKRHYTWWCSGEVGIAQSFIKAYEVLGNPSYKIYAEGALNNFPAEITQACFNQCHGLSSLGEIYLEAFRVFEDEKYLSRASWISNLILHCRKRHAEHGTYWQIEHERQPTGSFMNGNSGLLHFLLRYCFPNDISMPLQPFGHISWLPVPEVSGQSQNISSNLVII